MLGISGNRTLRFDRSLALTALTRIAQADRSARLGWRWAILALAEQDHGSALCDWYRRLWQRFPELRVVAEKDASAAPFQRR